jgi:hypothetical protein
MLQEMYFPRSYEFMANYGKEMLLKCDAVLALDAATYTGGDFMYKQTESKGRDDEVYLAEYNDIPVFNHVIDLYKWVETL